MKGLRPEMTMKEALAPVLRQSLDTSQRLGALTNFVDSKSFPTLL